MGNRIQGEGDYEAGRRFQKEEQEFVKRKFGNKAGKQQAPFEDEMDDSGIHAEAGHDEIEDDDDTQIADGSQIADTGSVFQNERISENEARRKRPGDRGQTQPR